MLLLLPTTFVFFHSTFLGVGAFVIYGQHVTIFVAVILEVTELIMGFDLGGRWIFEVAAGLSFILPLLMFLGVLFINRLIEAVFTVTREDFGRDHTISKLPYIWKAFPVNANDVAPNLWGRNNIHPAGKPYSSYFMASEHGAAYGNELKFATIDGEEYESLREKGTKPPDFVGLHWIGIGDGEETKEAAAIHLCNDHPLTAVRLEHEGSQPPRHFIK